jgi:pimeloyl-ACP methyl ester carboxylesterase
MTSPARIGGRASSSVGKLNRILLDYVNATFRPEAATPASCVVCVGCRTGVNSLYGVDAPWELRAAFEAEDRPGEFDRNAGAYALRTAAGLLRLWDRSIPVDDKSEWRDPVVAESYVDTALASDPLSETHTPPAMRTPSGFQLDSYEMSRGWRPWQASDLRVPTLVIRGERDFWSRPRDLEALGDELVSAPRARTVTIPDGTHHLFNDRPERGRTRFLEEVTTFLAVD